jgi:hypothetical protein
VAYVGSEAVPVIDPFPDFQRLCALSPRLELEQVVCALLLVCAMTPKLSILIPFRHISFLSFGYYVVII